MWQADEREAYFCEIRMIYGAGNAVMFIGSLGKAAIDTSYARAEDFSNEIAGVGTLLVDENFSTGKINSLGHELWSPSRNWSGYGPNYHRFLAQLLKRLANPPVRWSDLAGRAD